MRFFKILLIFLSVFVLSKALATEYQFLQYRVEDGLSTDIIKCVSEDSWGYIWIGTDQGLLQYNGYKFINYPKATNSPFIKDFIKLKDGRLLVLDDLGLTEIINKVDTVIFKRVIEGARNPTDSTLWYPKTLFQDSRGNLWISEPQSVVVYDGQGLRRITFGTQYNSSSFIRSFSFAELPDGRVLISSNNGGFFTYDLRTNTLTPLKMSGFTGDVNHMRLWNNQVYIAGTLGFYKVLSLEGDVLKIELIKQHNTVSYIQPLSKTELLLTTFLDNSFVYTPMGNISDLPFDMTTVNQSFLSNQGDVWMATEKGLVLLKPQIFREIKSDLDNIYIEAVTKPEYEDKIYFLSKEHIRSFSPDEEQSEIFKVLLGGYYLSALFRQDKLWVSNTWHIIAYNGDGTEYKRFDFSDYGRYIFDICLDKDNNVWLTQEAGIGLKEIDSNYAVKVYGKEQGLDTELTVVRANEKGIYAGANNATGYLYFKKYGESTFTNSSKPFSPAIDGEFRVEDLAFDGDTVWLATSLGLFKQTPKAIERVDLEAKFANIFTKMVRHQPNTPYIWFANSFGLIQYNKLTGEYNLYDESHGLPSNSINNHGLLFTDNGVYVGTANGLAYSDYNFNNLKKTPAPHIVRFTADDKSYSYTELSDRKLPSNPHLELVLSSPVYPGNKVHYQYKFNGDSVWYPVPENGILTFSKLGSGHYSFSFRAKRYGNFTWSDPSRIEFTIEKAFYETFFFRLAVIITALVLIIITRYATTRILRKRQTDLERLVTERTNQLAKTNLDLMERNRELDQFVYSTSHDLSAPLKSIRGLINIANYETDPEMQKVLLKRMDASVVKLEKFIKDVINYSRNVRLELEKKPVKLKPLVEEILDNISHVDYFHEINISVNIEESVEVETDETRMRIILNNLISNAVKFQRIHQESYPEVVISYKWANDTHIIRVKDNGHGIPQKLQGKIFDMFFRANTTSDGSGLGLYILKETVHKLGGEIRVTSEEGAGSEFTVFLPA